MTAFELLGQLKLFYFLICMFLVGVGRVRTRAQGLLSGRLRRLLFGFRSLVPLAWLSVWLGGQVTGGRAGGAGGPGSRRRSYLVQK